MCLIVIGYNYHPDYKLIFAANRDEFYQRPSSPADFWIDEPSLLAGKDLKEGGTWCGITKNGRFAAITNYRDMKSIKKDALSRGRIVTDFLLGTSSPETYSKGLIESSDLYNGYGLIFGDRNDLFFFSNQTKKLIKIKPGVHGLSNHLLDTPWFKVKKGKELLKKAIDKKDTLVDDLFLMLSDKTFSPKNELPDTGLPKEIEKSISSIFVETPDYGTHSSTVILIDKKDTVTFIEKSLDTQTKKWTINAFKFEMVII
jgi:uncharacterized protein with NRDE domain